LFAAGPSHGAPPQNVRMADNTYLLDHVGGGFDLLCFTHQTNLDREVVALVQRYQAQGIPIRLTAIGKSSVVEGAHQVLLDSQGHIAKRYGIDLQSLSTRCAAYLLRPDQHVCARWHMLDATRLQQALQTALMR